MLPLVFLKLFKTQLLYGGGGSRTPVRKALPPEDYMLSSFRCGPTLASPPQFAARAQSEQETRTASPIVPRRRAPDRNVAASLLDDA